MKHGRICMLCGLLLAAALLMAVNTAAKEPTAGERGKATGKQAQSYVPPTDANLYAGTETCRTCHEEKAKAYEASRHFATKLGNKRGPQWEGCEACHGPGKAHAEAGGDKAKIYRFDDGDVQEMSQRCLACHAFGEEQANFLRSEHSRNEVGCLSCHSIHKAATEKALLKAPQAALCFSCHLAVKPEFSKPFHHKVSEGLIACGDCHNPHGAFELRQVRSSAARDAVCFKCHASKAGPFAVEHAAMRTEGCTACHSPHGSPNAQLLKRSQVNLLCLECHTTTAGSAAPGLPSFHNQAQKYQACTLCHTAIHGSNSDPFLMRP